MKRKFKCLRCNKEFELEEYPKTCQICGRYDWNIEGSISNRRHKSKWIN